MSDIEISKIIDPIPTSDGAGVKLKRSIGTPEADYIDPFLMLDEFGSTPILLFNFTPAPSDAGIGSIILLTSIFDIKFYPHLLHLIVANISSHSDSFSSA